MSDLAIVRTLTVHPDLRGSVRETYRESWFPEVPPVKQLVRSESVPGTLRGMHLHKKQWDIWHFVEGTAVVRLRDHTVPYSDLYIDADPTQVIAIPPGISHGFYSRDGCVLMYALTEEYTGDDEFGWYPFDALPGPNSLLGRLHGDGWPRNHAGLVMSERDLRAPRLLEFRP